MSEERKRLPVDDHVGDAVTSASVRYAIEELASGAVFHWDADGGETLIRPLRQPEGGTVEVLLRRGWIEGRNGIYRLTDEGLRAYLRSTDELGDGQLLHPHEWRY